MVVHSGTDTAEVVRSDWYRALSKYERPDPGKAVWQILNTVVPYMALWAIMIWMLRAGISYWFTLPLIAVAAGLLVRIFIFFHDCCHGSFLASRGVNKILGTVFGVMVFTPYEDWQHCHAGHHSSSGDLDRRGMGDVWTLTVKEYLAAPMSTRIAYRFMRNPFVLFLVGSMSLFLVFNRFPHKAATPRARRSVLVTNLAILSILGLACVTIGLRHYLMLQLPIIGLAGAMGIWLFYVQHQFEDDYWERHERWDPIRAALEGSSYYKLPKVLQWFSGNIGLHHVHHLRPRIPNYNLQHCYNETPALQQVKPITLLQSLRCIFLNLWDESARKMVSFRSLASAKRR